MSGGRGGDPKPQIPQTGLAFDATRVLRGEGGALAGRAAGGLVEARCLAFLCFFFVPGA